jgi:sugar phosphate isomerase/epimerase
METNSHRNQPNTISVENCLEQPTVAEIKRVEQPSRRALLKSLGWMAAFGCLTNNPSLQAVEPFLRPGKPRLLLSLAAYSFRDDFVDVEEVPDGPENRRKMDMFRFLDYCADHGCLGAELTSYYFPKNPSDPYFARVRRHAFLRGIAISGTAVGNTFTHPPGPQRDEQIAMVKTWIRRASLIGAPHVRVFAGNTHPNQSLSEAKRLCIEAMEECAEVAGEHGIFLGIENHGGIVAESKDLLDIVQAIQSPWVGINLDTGNFHTEDPHRDLARCAPYAVNVQFKGMFRPRGQAVRPDDFARTFAILRDANYQGYVVLEYEMAEDSREAVPVLLRRMREFMV